VKNRNLLAPFIHVIIVMITALIIVQPQPSQGQEPASGRTIDEVVTERAKSPTPAAAPTYARLPVVDPGDAVWSGAKTLGAALFVVAFVLASAVLLRRHLPYPFGNLAKKKRIHILESVGLGEKRSLTLVEIDGLHLLLASSGNNVSLIKEFDTSADGSSVHPFKQEFAAELSKFEDRSDYKKAVGSLSRIRQELDLR
jgi:flagellar biogenesis protein FliO